MKICLKHLLLILLLVAWPVELWGVQLITGIIITLTLNGNSIVDHDHE